MKSFLIVVSLLVSASLVHARLGDTREQVETRYGLPKSEKPQKIGGPPIEGARELTFNYQGFKIRCALLLATDGKEYVVREEYARLHGLPTIKDFECDAILEAEANGLKWSDKKSGDVSLDLTKTVQSQFTQALMGKVWVRSDGAVAVHGLGGFPVRLELPQAAKYEAQMKAAKYQKERAGVPKF